MVKDLVCQMEVDEEDSATPWLEYEGKHYYFCTPLCMAQFQADPERYIKEASEGKSNRMHKGGGNK